MRPPSAAGPPASGRGARARRRLGQLLREPLLHFLVLGLAVFLARGQLGGTPERHRIRVGPDDVRRLASGYEWQFGRPPTAGELDQIVERHVEEEILYREGVALGLDRGDEIVRRRIAQKLLFLQEDAALVPEPDDDALRAFRARHAARYREPARATFRHLYFSPDRGGPRAAQARAAAAAAALRDAADRPAAEGADPFPGRDRYAAVDAAGVARAFGDSELARTVFDLPPRRWSGPLRSGYGWHLVYVETVAPARERPFAEVRDRLRADHVDEQRRALNAAALAAVKAKYLVLREDAAQ